MLPFDTPKAIKLEYLIISKYYNCIESKQIITLLNQMKVNILNYKGLYGVSI